MALNCNNTENNAATAQFEDQDSFHLKLVSKVILQSSLPE